MIRRVRQTIPDFALKGQLHAETEFKPHWWILRIGDDGWARQIPCSSEDVKPAKWAHLARQAQKPANPPGIEQAADEIVIRNEDGKVRATWSILVQERARGVALYVKADDIIHIHSEIDGSMEVTLREPEVKALADWLTQ